MAITYTVTKGLRTNNGSFGTNTNSYSVEGEHVIEVPIPAASTNLLIAFTLDVSTVIALGISASKALTIKTNSSSAPDDTITLADSESIIYGNDEPDAVANPFTTDVTALYVTNAGAAASVLKIAAGLDVTA
jgi:hypothetical protein